MDTGDILKPTKKDKFLHITVTEIICVLMIILVVLVAKYFFKARFTEIKDWYNQNFLVDIDINQVLEDDKDAV